MPIYFITGNKNKFEEIKKILPQIERMDMDLPEIQEIDAKEILKAKLIEALKHKKSGFIVEDTSLYLECLHGLPGPLIKWFYETMGNQELYNLAFKLGNTKATAKTIIGYAKNPRELYFFEGVLNGLLVPPRGSLDFGWGPIFQPEGFLKTFGEMEKAEKNSISMRAIALNKLKEFLKGDILKNNSNR